MSKFRLPFLPKKKEVTYTEQEVEAIKQHFEMIIEEERKQQSNLYAVIETQQNKIYSLQSQLVSCQIFFNRTSNALDSIKSVVNQIN